MFNTFTVLIFIAIATAPADSTDFTIQAHEEVFKGERCDSEWCLLDTSTQPGYQANVAGTLLELSREDQTIAVPIDERITIPVDIDWSTASALETAMPGVQLQLVREPARLVIIRVQGDDKTLFAVIEYGGLESAAEPGK